MYDALGCLYIARTTAGNAAADDLNHIVVKRFLQACKQVETAKPKEDTHERKNGICIPSFGYLLRHRLFGASRAPVSTLSREEVWTSCSVTAEGIYTQLNAVCHRVEVLQDVYASTTVEDS